jgi:hypothetical protein
MRVQLDWLCYDRVFPRTGGFALQEAQFVGGARLGGLAGSSSHRDDFREAASRFGLRHANSASSPIHSAERKLTESRACQSALKKIVRQRSPTPENRV